MVKRPLHVEFVPQQLTSYSGLELLRRYLRQCALPRRLRAACASTGGDYGGGRLALLILALFYVGARRLEHLRYLGGDPLIARFCGLARIPTARTVGNWLRQFTQTTVAPLVQLNHDLVIDAITRLALPRLTIDVDGTVVRTGGRAVTGKHGIAPDVHRPGVRLHDAIAPSWRSWRRGSTRNWRHSRSRTPTRRAQGLGLVTRRRSIHRNAPRATTVSTIVAAAKKSGAAGLPVTSRSVVMHTSVGVPHDQEVWTTTLGGTSLLADLVK